MRLMLGYSQEQPTLLVEVEHDPYDPKSFLFEFRVVNGAWKGKFVDGDIYLLKRQWQNQVIHDKFRDGYYETEKVNSVPLLVLCENQDRLRSVPFYDYQTVFDNYHNPDYVAPKPKPVEHNPLWDDDIPF